MDTRLKDLSNKYNIDLTNCNYEATSDIFLNDNVDDYINNKEMFFALGMYYQYHKKDYYKMLEFYSKDIMNDNNRCFNEILKYFSFTNNGKHDIHFTKYMKIRKDSDNGDIPSIIILTKNYESIYTKHKDISALIEKYYLIAFRKGNVYCMRQLACFYSLFKNETLSKEEQIKLMKKYYLMAIKSGDNISAYNLGCYFYNNKENGYYNEILIKRFFEIAFERGMFKAYYLLGRFYQNRNNSNMETSMTDEEKFELMKKYYLLAIEKDEVESMFALGDYYRTNKENGNYNFKLMKKYYKMAIEKNHTNAMSNLGLYYQCNKENGNYKYGLMKKYYKMAIKKCNKIAITNLGNYYINVEKKTILGVKYLELGVKHNYSLAMNSLGTYYRNTQNIELMIKYYTLSCYQNDTDGMFLFGHYYESIKDYETMEKYYKMAISRGHVNAKKQMDEHNVKIQKEMDDKYPLVLA
jgi:TPR repeat protein